MIDRQIDHLITMFQQNRLGSFLSKQPVAELSRFYSGVKDAAIKAISDGKDKRVETLYPIEGLIKAEFEKRGSGVLKEEKSKSTSIGSTILPNDRVVETIYDPGKNPPYQFAVFDPKTEHVEFLESIEFPNGEKLVPIRSEMVEKGVILLPTGIEEYGNEKQLTEETGRYIYKYLDIDSLFEQICIYYTLLAWIHENFNVIPYLRVIGDYGTGKSRFLQVIGSILYKPMFASGATTASPVFRLIEQFGGSLVMDEADFKNSDVWSEIVKIYNCGYMKGFPVLRTEGDGKNRQVKSYAVFGPKILATRKKFDDSALESRMLTQEMEASSRPDMPLILPEEFEKEAQTLRNKLLLWRFRTLGKTPVNSTFSLEGIEPRLKQIILPMASIIKNEALLSDLKDFITSYQNQIILDRGLELPATILQITVDLHEEGESLTMKNIAERHNSGIVEKSGEKQITPHRVGWINRNFLRLPTKQIHGVYHIIWDFEKVKKLCNRYGIELKGEEVVAVEDLPENLQEFVKPDVVEKYEQEPLDKVT